MQMDMRKGGFGNGQTNDQGPKLLELADAYEMVMANTLLMRSLKRLIRPYWFSDDESMIDYVLL